MCPNCCVQYCARLVLVKTCTTLYLAIFLLLFLVIAGAWLGFWVVHKLVLEEDGSIDTGVSQFVAWSIRFLASALILQSSVDPLLCAEAWICGVLISSILRRLCRPKYVLRFFKNLSQIDTSYLWESQELYASPTKGSYDSRTFKTNLNGTIRPGFPLKPRSLLSEKDTYYSTFHKTPEQKKLSKDEYDKITKDTTKKAMEELVSSPDFSKWAVAHADRITLAPKKETTARQRRWYQWLWLENVIIVAENLGVQTCCNVFRVFHVGSDLFFF